MAKPNLYICHTAYHVLIALVRALRAGGGQAAVLSSQVPDSERLSRQLIRCGAFGEVHLVDEHRCPGMVTDGPLQHWRARRMFERQCGLKLDPRRYAGIYISNDWSALGRYLQDLHAGYTLCEDTVGSTIGPDQHLVYDQRESPDYQAGCRGQGYLYWGDSPCCRRVESEDATRCLLFPPQKMVTFSCRSLLAGLTEEEKAAVRRVFLTQPLPEDPDALADATLLLPRSFAADGLMTQQEQNRMFCAVAARYADGPLYIKTHPRDTTDYGALFPRAVILERTMPSEVLNFCLPGKFKRAVSVQSFVLRGFTAANECILLTLEEARALAGQGDAAGDFAAGTPANSCSDCKQ